MSEANLLAALGQVSCEEAGKVFRDFSRGSIRQFIVDAIASEVQSLYGDQYASAESVHYRAETAPGQVRYENREVRVSRPCVRRQGLDGSSEEVRLKTYQAADGWIRRVEHLPLVVRSQRPLPSKKPEAPQQAV